MSNLIKYSNIEKKKLYVDYFLKIKNLYSLRIKNN